MADKINSLATLVGSIVLLVMTLVTLWRGSIKVNAMIEESKQTACKLSLLETKILRGLSQIQIQQRQAEERGDRRFDRIEGKLNYLFGRTNTTIPPKD
jgi:hypothetical protein